MCSINMNNDQDNYTIPAFAMEFGVNPCMKWIQENKMTQMSLVVPIAWSVTDMHILSTMQQQ